jgi:hypothetical protein
VGEAEVARRVRESDFRDFEDDDDKVRLPRQHTIDIERREKRGIG